MFLPTGHFIAGDRYKAVKGRVGTRIDEDDGICSQCAMVRRWLDKKSDLLYSQNSLSASGHIYSILKLSVLTWKTEIMKILYNPEEGYKNKTVIVCMRMGQKGGSMKELLSVFISCCRFNKLLSS